MINKTAIKKARKPHTQSKAAQIRKLFEQGKWTPKQIAEKLGTPLSPPSHRYQYSGVYKKSPTNTPPCKRRSSLSRHAKNATTLHETHIVTVHLPSRQRVS